MTSPPKPRTGYAHSKCYARELNDCSTKISGEHYISENVLVELTGGARMVKVTNPAWAPDGGEVEVPIASLAPNVLCTRHNAALSGLDANAGRLFRALRATKESRAAGLHLFNGRDVERWLLKALCGLSAIRGDWTPPRVWLRILFGELVFPAPWGMYLGAVVGRVFPSANEHVHLSRISVNGALGGFRMELIGWDFYLLARELDDPHKLVAGAMRRPNCINVVAEPKSRDPSGRICFYWEDRWPGIGWDLR
ncbi:MAG TPA: hypothetical protein VI072_09170 [Polyangiaceae bacterium]